MPATKWKKINSIGIGINALKMSYRIGRTVSRLAGQSRFKKLDRLRMPPSSLHVDEFWPFFPVLFVGMWLLVSFIIFPPGLAVLFFPPCHADPPRRGKLTCHHRLGSAVSLPRTGTLFESSLPTPAFISTRCFCFGRFTRRFWCRGRACLRSRRGTASLASAVSLGH